jgi:FixJ family two-component response regulator
MDEKLRVFVIDDDPLALRTIERVLRSNGFTVEVFTSPESFLARGSYDGPACVLLDLTMPGLNGLDVQEAMAKRGISHPIIFFTGQEDVPSTSRAMRDGALDFLVKPLDEPQLVEAIERAAVRAAALRRQQPSEAETEARLARLTNREREVCDLVARRLLNQQIAWELGTGEKVVKVHRCRAMRKLEIDSVAALARLLSRLPAGKFDQV